MLILEAENIKKYYSDRLIIEFDNLRIYSGDKIGIVGQNGSGKTTLMNILSNEIEPDEGFIKQYCDISYIRQFSDEKIETRSKNLKDSENPKALKALGEFNLNDKLHQDVFSGGEKTRIKIANALSRDNLLLLADEPTANLDYKGIELLKQKLSEVDSFLLISHDRNLLDSLCNKILEVKDGKFKFYNGNYSFYKEQSEKEQQHEEQEYEKYVTEKIKLEEAIIDRQNKSRTMRKAPRRMGNSEARLHTRLANEKQEKINNAVNSLKTRLEKLEVKEKPRALPQIKLDFSLTNPPENKIVISAEKLTFSYNSSDSPDNCGNYHSQKIRRENSEKVIFDNAKFKIYNSSKTALWGENGTGKTTLLNLISYTSINTVKSIKESIHIVPKARIGYFHQGFENLDYSKSVLENVLRDSVQNQTVARTILARLLIQGNNVYKNVGILSGGERIKVSFAKLFVSNANILLLDEPTNYLDMKSIEALENVLRDYEGTVVFVSHDSVFVNAVADRLLIFGNKSITEFEGTLHDYMLKRQKPKTAIDSGTERIALQMRIAEIVTRLCRRDMEDGDKEALEEEYSQLVLKLKKCNREQ
ncbi:MAG TPA: ABC-F type ribosomal protection protein [Clostridiales bacterium]|nr:ABC-F type ribosomal protection protein [Clostridiales bacterium]